jgi:hypothetical protein
MKTHLDQQGLAGVPSQERTRRDRFPMLAKDVGKGIGESVGNSIRLVADPRTVGIEAWLVHLYTIKRLRTVGTNTQKSTSRPFLHFLCRVPSIQDWESCDSSSVLLVSVPLSLSKRTKSNLSSK